jgi:hypothetical protein
MSTTEPALRARNLRTLALLAALFLLPLALAFLTYYGTGWRPLGSVNHGQLITPARPLPETQLLQVLPGSAAVPGRLFHERWSLVYIGDGSCTEACREALYVMRQTRLSLNNDMTRVTRVFLATADCCARVPRARACRSGRGGCGRPCRAALLAQFPPAERSTRCTWSTRWVTS